MQTRIKFCGLMRPEDIQFALALDVHALGFVFYSKSPRYVSAEQASELLKLIPPFVTTVGLFVNSTTEEVTAVLKTAQVNLLQFHGDETPAQCHQIAEAVQRPFIRALRVKSGMNASDLLKYEAEYRASSPWFHALLLDTFVEDGNSGVGNSYGGSGKVFDWSIIPKELAHRVVLSGGLTVHNVSGALELVRPWAVDVSSGIEQAKGVKDPLKMRSFIDAVHVTDANLSN